VRPPSPVTFTNRQGHRLFGILEAPAVASSRDIAVLLLSPGALTRGGPRGLYRPIATMVARLGIPVLRFDFHGLGDSEGTVPETLLRDVYSHIEMGRFVEDTIDAMDWLQRTRGIGRFILAGLCGGAITGLLTAERDSRVVGLFGIGLPAVLDSRAASGYRHMSVGQLDALGHAYVQRLRSPEAWRRLLTFQTDNRLILRLATHMVQWRVLRWAPDQQPPAPEGDNTNPLFAPAFLSMVESRRPILLVFGGSDRLLWEFQDRFVSRHRERLAGTPSAYDLCVIRDANHVLSASEWRQAMLDASRAWLVQHFGAELRCGAGRAAVGG
jgi:hypothetical protein